MDIKGLLTRKPVPRRREDEDSCKIKIKKTARGSEMEISKGCTPQQIKLAQERLTDTNQIETSSTDD